MYENNFPLNSISAIKLKVFVGLSRESPILKLRFCFLKLSATSKAQYFESDSFLTTPAII